MTKPKSPGKCDLCGGILSADESSLYYSGVCILNPDWASSGKGLLRICEACDDARLKPKT